MEPISSNHYSVDTQLSDAVDALKDDEREAFDKAFPEWNTITWEPSPLSHIDTEASGVDVEYTSWAIDWIEENTLITWYEGEPYLMGDDSEDPEEPYEL